MAGFVRAYDSLWDSRKCEKRLDCFFSFSAVTQLVASRLRIRQIEEILREHNRHRRDLALGLYGTSVSNMKKLVCFYFFFIKLFKGFGYSFTYIPTICTKNVKMRFRILEKLERFSFIIIFYFKKINEYNAMYCSNFKLWFCLTLFFLKTIYAY